MGLRIFDLELGDHAKVLLFKAWTPRIWLRRTAGQPSAGGSSVKYRAHLPTLEWIFPFKLGVRTANRGVSTNFIRIPKKAVLAQGVRMLEKESYDTVFTCKSTIFGGI